VATAFQPKNTQVKHPSLPLFSNIARSLAITSPRKTKCND